MRRWVKGLLFGAAAGLSGAVFGFLSIGEEFEKNVGLPWMFKVRGEIPAPPEVVVVAIDQNTGGHLDLPALPREWSRSIHARLVESLVKRGASVIAFDLEMDKPRNDEGDIAFADAVDRGGRVVLYEKLNGKNQPIVDSTGREKGWMWVEQLIPPIPPLAEAAKGLGPFPLPKMQIAVNQFWAFKPSAGEVPTLPAVALQIHALGSYERWLEILKRAGASGLEGLPRRRADLARAPDIRDLMRAQRNAFRKDPELAGRVVEAASRTDGPDTDVKEQRLFRALAGLYAGDDNRFLNFYGPPGAITTIPYHAVIKGGDPNVDPEELNLTGKAVFVGFSSKGDPGQPDRHFTVFTTSKGVDLSGVEIAATAFGNLLTGRSIRPSGSLTSALILLGFGLLLGAGVYLVPALVGVPLAFVLAMLYAAAAQAGFDAADLWLPLATPLLIQFPMALLIGLSGQYLLERRKERQVSQLISNYIPENVIASLTESGFDPSSLDTVVYGTCLATDMSGFTTVSEQMKPKELASFINTYFDRMAMSLKRHDVDITEFHADTIMCAWTATQPSDLIHDKAVFAALDLVDAIGQFTEQHGRFRFTARVGLETGQFYVGHTGGGGRFAYSILGDCANTAARLESLNKQIGTTVLATSPAVADVGNVVLRPLGQFRLVGKSNPTPVIEVMAREEDASQAQHMLCERFTEALDMFGLARWSRAAVLFRSILRDYPDDGPSRFYLDRSQNNHKRPPRHDDPSVIFMEAK